MKSFSFFRNLFVRFTTFSLLFFALLTTSNIAMAEEPAEEASTAFGGNFAEFSLRGGPTLVEGENGWSLDAGFRNSIPFYLTDNRVSYRYRSLNEQAGTALHGIHGTFGIHPFYLALLSGSLTGHFLASLHLELGLGAQLGRVFEEGELLYRPGFSWSLGTGFDLPLIDPNHSHGLWLNVNYRRTWTTLTSEIDGNPLPLNDHAFHLGLGWRINGGLW